jgi:hypothetical protein
VITNGYLLLEDEVRPARDFRRAYVEPFGETEWRALVEVAGVDKPVVIFAGEEQRARDEILYFVGLKKPPKGPRRIQVIET